MVPVRPPSSVAEPVSMPASSPSRFLLAYAAFLAVYLGAGVAVLAGLDRAGRLPAPPLTATDCIDEKFRFLRRTDIRTPDIVAVGSSVTWRNIDFARLAVGRAPLNAATCYLNVHQTAHLARFVLDAFPSTRTVLVVLAMRDFRSCAGDGAFFDRRTALRYVDRQDDGRLLYLLNFRPTPFLTAALGTPRIEGQAPGTSLLDMDRFGSGPILVRPPDIREDVAVDPGCLPHLRAMASEMRSRDRGIVVVLMPPMPAWIAAYDPGGVRDGAWRRAVHAALDGTGALLLDGVAFGAADAAFTDPAHFHWEELSAFMDWLRPRLPSVADPPADRAGRAAG